MGRFVFWLMRITCSLRVGTIKKQAAVPWVRRNGDALAENPEFQLLELLVQMMAVVCNQRALIFQERTGIFAADPAQCRGRSSRVYATGYCLCAGILTFDFLRHPSPTVLFCGYSRI